VSRLRPHLTYSNVMSTIAVFGVLAGGSAWAATKIGTNQIKAGAVTTKKLHKNAVTTTKIKGDAVTGDKVKDESLTGKDLDESTLSAPINVDHAKLADNATNLGGQPASDYRLHCPGNLAHAGDLCFEFDLRPLAPYTAALKACALDQRRLPNEGELALVFDHLGAPQSLQWAAGHWGPGTTSFQGTTNVGAVLSETSARDIRLFGVDAGPGFQAPFRCVTSATN
jgi:hypothetical protein